MEGRTILSPALKKKKVFICKIDSSTCVKCILALLNLVVVFLL